MYIELESPTLSTSPIQDLRCKVCISKNERSKEAGKEESMKGQLLLQCWTVGDGKQGDATLLQSSIQILFTISTHC
jgi:hypothetical protein